MGQGNKGKSVYEKLCCVNSRLNIVLTLIKIAVIILVLIFAGVVGIKVYGWIKGLGII